MAYFENDQWSVTDFGLESKPTDAPASYKIKASRLLEMGGIGKGELYDFPLQVAQKSWVSIEQFAEAYTQALEIHGSKLTGAVDEAVLKQSIDQAIAGVHS